MASSDIATFQLILEDDDQPTQQADLSWLPQEDLHALNVCVAEFRSAQKRIVGEVWMMSTQLVKMREILKTQFFNYTTHQLGLNKRTVQRYMNYHAVLKAHFIEGDGQLMVGVSDRVTAAALHALSPDTDPVIIDEVKRAVTGGEKVNVAYLNELIARYSAEKEAEFKSSLARAEVTEKQLKRRLEQTDLDNHRLQREMNAQTEMLRRNREIAAAMEEENRQLRNATAEVRYEERTVEVVPVGFKNAEEAILAKQAQLDKLEADRTKLEQGITTLQEEHNKARETFNQVSACAAEFGALKEQIQTMMGRFPMETIVALASREKSVKSACQAFGENLVLFGQQLAKAGD